MPPEGMPEPTRLEFNRAYELITANGLQIAELVVLSRLQSETVKELQRNKHAEPCATLCGVQSQLTGHLQAHKDTKSGVMNFLISVVLARWLPPIVAALAGYYFATREAIRHDKGNAMEIQQRGDIPATCPISSGESARIDPLTGLVAPCQSCLYRRNDAPGGGCPGRLQSQAMPSAPRT